MHPNQALVHVEHTGLVLAGPHLLVLLDQKELGEPGQRRRGDGENSRADHGNQVARFVGLGPQVRRPDERDVHNHGHHGDGHSLLLLCLTADGTAPTEDERVDTVRADCEDGHRHVSTSHVEGRAGSHKSNHRDGLGDGDVPRSLVQLTRGPRDGNRDGSGDEVGRAGERESDGLSKAKRLDDSGEEVLESVGGKMHVRHEAEDPDQGILGRLLETHHGAGLALVLGGVELHTVVGQVALLLSEPPRREWRVGEHKVSNHSDDKGDGALEDEEPLPAGKSSEIVHAMEDSGSNETSESSGENVAGVENGDAGGNLLTGVEEREEVDGAGIVGSFSDTEEEAGEEEADEVLGQGGEGRHNSPKHHHDTLHIESVRPNFR